MTIYKKVLGKDFEKLHPMLQKRYELNQPFYARGVMKEIKGAPRWLYPLVVIGKRRKLLFIESGRDIPFSITNTPNNGQVHWARAFDFGKKIRYFNALMSLDEDRKVIKDYLGEPAMFYSDLQLMVENRALTIKSKSQRLVLGKYEIPLPKWFQGLATVHETFNDSTNEYEIKVEVRNPLIGTVFKYEGTFKQVEFL